MRTLGKKSGHGVDELGRVCIPVAIRRMLNLTTGTPMEFQVEGDTVLMRSARTTAVPVERVTTIVQEAFAREGIIISPGRAEAVVNAILATGGKAQHKSEGKS